MGAYQAPKVRQSAPKRSGADKDEVLISSEGKYLDFAKKMAAQLPDIREDKVAAVTKRLESGGLNVSASMVANKMLDNI